MTGPFITQGHLGGYFEGGDPDTMYPEMWRYVVEREHVRSVLDVGCGDGAAMGVFRDLGCEVVIGIDGCEQDDIAIIQHDFATGPFSFGGCWLGAPPPFLPDLSGSPDVTATTDWDLVWSAEFVEHVEEQFVDNFMASMVKAPLVLMTHAVPGQGGHHHVNCRDSGYWRAVFAERGFYVDEELTRETRALAHSYYAATGLALRRTTG